LKKTKNIALILIYTKDHDQFRNSIKKNVHFNKFKQVLEIVHPNYQNNFPIEISCKLLFNVITTCSCIQKGRVYGNTMINLGVSNNKLFFRSINVIQQLMGVSEPVARESLLKSIYDVDVVTIEIETALISSHLQNCNSKTFCIANRFAFIIKQ